LCEGAGSLLPGSPKPAIVLRIEQQVDGTVAFHDARRSVIRSRAKLAYETVDTSSVPFLHQFAERSERAEARRGAVRSDLPEQEIRETADGHFVLELRSLLASETMNAALSLSANLAAGDYLADRGVGLFRVMEMPDDNAVRSLRRLARALRIDWPEEVTLGAFQRTLAVDDPRNRAFLVSARRAGGGASYATLGCGAETDVVGRPHHAAIAGTYVHATAPLRRLADRYVLDLLCELTTHEAAGDSLQLDPTTSSTLGALPEVMRRSSTLGSRIERGAVDLAECVLLEPMVGTQFRATVLESADTGAVIQIAEPPVRSRLPRSAVSQGAVGGSTVDVRLERVDTATRSLSFSFVSVVAPA
jgi:exoribonuclease R